MKRQPLKQEYSGRANVLLNIKPSQKGKDYYESEHS